MLHLMKKWCEYLEHWNNKYNEPFVYGMVMENNQLVASSLKQQHEIRYAHQPSYLIAMMQEHEETNVS